ncbi:MAG TPA: DUF1549 domain-containing protein [Thermoanaerobaculia bacterium]|nr:DUF1549 domain-containing protein [Thermoanaerobaculia bacterium]
MRLGKVLVVLTAFAASATGVAQESVAPAAPDCTVRPEQMRGHERNIWHTLSVRAEAVAPSATANAAAAGRGHAVLPPSGPPVPTYQPANFIDDEIFGKMVRDGILWTAASGDSEFLRRVTLDLTGAIPTPDAVKAFLADSSANKREKVIDQLLASDAFVDRWTMWLGDLVQNVSTATNNNIGTASRDYYYSFLHDSIKAGKPYDWIVRQLISGTGDESSHGEVEYWRRDIQNNGPIQDTYDNLSSSTGARFLAVRLQCLSCHGGFGHLEQVNSSLAKKNRMDFWQNAAFFSQVTVTQMRDPTGVNLNVLADNTTGAYRLNTNSGNKTPRQPVNGVSVVDPAFILSGEKPAPGEVRRAAYARMLTAHPQFARATVNYLWKELFGLGIVEPADNHDLNRQDPATLATGAVLQPTHPALLTKLAAAFVANGYDPRATLKLMVMSNAYQLSSRYSPSVWNESWTPYFARHYPRRLMAEALLDAVVRATGVGASITTSNNGSLILSVPRAMMLADTTQGGDYRTFLNTFGRGNRDDEPRSDDSSAVQALMLLNDPIIVSRVHNAAAGSTVQTTLSATKDPGAITDTLYLTTLSRYPTETERAAGIAQLGSGDLTKKTEDLQFALLNKLEFLFK